MAGSGYDIGVGLSGSASSGASQSGALQVLGGGNYGGTSYGPGSVVQLTTDQRGSVGSSSGGVSWIIAAAVAVVAFLGFMLLRKT